eukprot:jgi/Bigna1/127129/aug1.4_g1837
MFAAAAALIVAKGYFYNYILLTPKKRIREGVMGFDAQVEVGCSILSDRFRSKVELHDHKQQHSNGTSQIVAQCTESSVVDKMHTVWTFIPKGDNVTEVVFEVQIDIYDPIKYSTLSSVFSYMAQTQMDAFIVEVENRLQKK